jgi:histidyl-tRNA synthetase
MEQKDYILREIEKISKIISSIREKLFGSKNNLAIITEQEINNLNEMLLEEINFDFEKFLKLNSEASGEYLKKFEGFSIENIESLAELISQIGFIDKSEQSKKYLKKSLQLYELAILKSKTYSFDREMKMQMIKNAL